MANIQLKKPAIGSQNWGTIVNDNFSKIEQGLNDANNLISLLQKQVQAMGQLSIAGYVDIAQTRVTSTNNVDVVELAVYSIQRNGEYGDLYDKDGVTNASFVNTMELPDNTCYKVCRQYIGPNGSQLSDDSVYNPTEYSWEEGDFLVIGQLVGQSVNRQLSRLPISIGAYMEPSVENGQITWTVKRADTNIKDIITALPMEYAFGTVTHYTEANIVNNIITTNATCSGILQNAYQQIPLVTFYDKTTMQPIYIQYELVNNNGKWGVQFNRDTNEDDTFSFHMYITMITND